MSVWIPVAVLVAVAMDGWAGLLHRRMWHGWLWNVHASHHRRRSGRFEANDALSASHAPFAIALVLQGCLGEPGLARELAFGVGVGMSGFGIAYLLVHDGLAHGRLPVGFLLRVPVLGGVVAAVVRAHLIHHGRGAKGPYSLFLGPWELRRHDRLTPPRARGLPRASPPTGPAS